MFDTAYVEDANASFHCALQTDDHRRRYTITKLLEIVALCTPVLPPFKKSEHLKNQPKKGMTKP
jgi:hypothetical protein